MLGIFWRKEAWDVRSTGCRLAGATVLRTNVRRLWGIVGLPTQMGLAGRKLPAQRPRESGCDSRSLPTGNQSMGRGLLRFFLFPSPKVMSTAGVRATKTEVEM